MLNFAVNAGLFEVIPDLHEKMELAEDKQSEFNKLADERLRKLKNEEKLYTSMKDRMEESVKASDQMLEASAKRLVNLEKEAALTEDQIKRHQDKLELERTSEMVSYRIGNAVGRSLDRMAEGIGSIADNLKYLGREMIAIIRQEVLIRPMAKSISEGLNSLILSSVPAKQHGGLAHGLTLVGERGPELVDFRRQGMVYDHEATRKTLAGMGGNTISVNFSPTISGGMHADEVRQMMYTEIMPQFSEVITSDINRAMHRKGPMRKEIKYARS